MVLRSLSIAIGFALLVAAIGPAVTHAAYCGPDGNCVPLKVRVPMSGPAMVPPGSGQLLGAPAMAGPRPLSCMPACPPQCPPPCPPPSCEPSCGTGFNPLSAVVGMVALPFKLIGNMVSRFRGCDTPSCAPGCCVPMMPPPCMPMCAPPVAKCKPQGMPRVSNNRPSLKPIWQ